MISKRGIIIHVYHPSNEASDIIATKKGFAALFASRLHEEGDVISNYNLNYILIIMKIKFARLIKLTHIQSALTPYYV